MRITAPPKKVLFLLPENVHRKVKARAARDGRPMADLIRELVQDGWKMKLLREQLGRRGNESTKATSKARSR